MATILYLFAAMSLLGYCECRIITLENDFNKIKTDQNLTEHVQPILTRLKTFKLPVQPRSRHFYEMLKRSMSQYSHRTADSLYAPHKYNSAATQNTHS